MRMTATQFEQTVARIEEILGDNVASVTWDAHVPDPDNPDRARQVDVLIERDGFRTLVECRHRRAPQDVTWIEELYGRRVSLHADAVIAVSSSGFSEGARKKGAALGIATRDFCDLTIEEIGDWGRAARTSIECVQFGRVQLLMVLPSSLVTPVATEPATLRKQSDGQPWPLNDLLKTVAEKIAETGEQRGAIRIQVFPRDLLFGGRVVNELFVEAEFRRLRIALILPAVRVYGHRQLDEASDSIVVESAEQSAFAILHARDGIRLVVDLSLVHLPERSILLGLGFDFGQSVTLRSLELIGEVTLDWSILPYVIMTVVKDSERHRSLLSEKPNHAVITLP